MNPSKKSDLRFILFWLSLPVIWSLIFFIIFIGCLLTGVQLDSSFTGTLLLLSFEIVALAVLFLPSYFFAITIYWVMTVKKVHATATRFLWVFPLIFSFFGWFPSIFLSQNDPGQVIALMLLEIPLGYLWVFIICITLFIKNKLRQGVTK